MKILAKTFLCLCIVSIWPMYFSDIDRALHGSQTQDPQRITKLIWQKIDQAKVKSVMKAADFFDPKALSLDKIGEPTVDDIEMIFDEEVQKPTRIMLTHGDEEQLVRMLLMATQAQMQATISGLPTGAIIKTAENKICVIDVQRNSDDFFGRSERYYFVLGVFDKHSEPKHATDAAEHIKKTASEQKKFIATIPVRNACGREIVHFSESGRLRVITRYGLSLQHGDVEFAFSDTDFEELCRVIAGETTHHSFVLTADGYHNRLTFIYDDESLCMLPAYVYASRDLSTNRI